MTNLQDLPAPDLLVDLLDPLLTQMVRHWWQSQHARLSAATTHQLLIPNVPTHILVAVPRRLAPSATLAALAPHVTVPQRTYIPYPWSPDQASALGHVWMLDALVKLHDLGQLHVAPVQVPASAEPGAGAPSLTDDAAGSLPLVLPGEDNGDDNAMDVDDDDNDDEQPLADAFPEAPSSKCAFQYTEAALDRATVNGHLDVLDWWLARHRHNPKRYPLKYTDHAMDSASWQGQVAALNWWLASGLEMRFSWAALADASEAGRIEVLEWWRQAELAGKLQRQIGPRVMVRASFENHVAALDWWADRGGLPSLAAWYCRDVVEVPAARGHVEVLKWWRAKIESGHVEPWIWNPSELVQIAAKRGRLEVLEWLMEQDLVSVRDKAVAESRGCTDWTPEARGWWDAQWSNRDVIDLR